MKNPKYQLTDYEFLELGDYTHEERLDMFTRAINDMAVKGIISPKQREEYLKNIETWLLELMEN